MGKPIKISIITDAAKAKAGIADTSSALGSLSQAASKADSALRKIGGGRNISLNIGKVKAQLAELERAQKNLGKNRVRIDADTTKVQAKLRALQQAREKALGAGTDGNASKAQRLKIDADITKAETKLKKLAAEGNRIDVIRGRVDLDTTRAQASLAKLERQQKRLSSLKNAASSIGSSLATAGATAGIVALSAGVYGLAKGLSTSVKTAADFQTSINEIGAISGATGPQLDKLRSKALQLGRDTTFSATGAASAISELSKAGVSVPDILNGAADAAVNLAAASGVDLPEAATIAANAMNQFKLKAKDLPGVADQIAGAANASAIDVGQFGYSLAQVGASAKLAGLSFEDTTTAIAELGNAGIVGSDAGTSLKTFLTRLQPATKKASDEFKRLGLITKDNGNLFYDQTGKLKSLAQVQQVLQTALKGRSQAEKQAALTTLFGSDAIRAAAILSENGAKGFDKLSTAINKVKAAQVASVRRSGFNASLEQLKGTLENVGIELGAKFLPKLTTAANAISDALTGKIKYEPLEKLKTLFPEVEAAASTFFHLLGSGTSGIDEASNTLNNGLVRGLDAVEKALPAATAYLLAFSRTAIAAFSAAASAGSGFGRVASGAALVLKGLSDPVRHFGDIAKGSKEISAGFAQAGKAGVTFGSDVAKIAGQVPKDMKAISRAVDNVKLEAKLKVDNADAKKRIDETAKALRAKQLTDPVTAKIRADIKDAESKRNEIVRKLKDKALTAPERIKLRADKKDADAKISDLKRALKTKELTSPTTKQLRVENAQAIAAAQQTKSALSAIQSKTVTVSVRYQQIGRGAVPGASGANGVRASGFGIENPSVIEDDASQWGADAGKKAGEAALRSFSEAIRRAVDTSQLSGIAQDFALNAFKAFTGTPDDIAQYATSLSQSISAAGEDFKSSLFNLNGQIAEATTAKATAQNNLVSVTTAGTKAVAAADRAAKKALEKAADNVQKAREKLAYARTKKVDSKAGQRVKDRSVKLAQDALDEAQKAKKKQEAQNKRDKAAARKDAAADKADAAADVKDTSAELATLQDQLAYLRQSYRGLASAAQVQAAQKNLLTFSAAMYDIAQQRADIADKLTEANQGLADAIAVRDNAIAQYRDSALSFASISGIELKAATDATAATDSLYGASAGQRLSAGLQDRLASITSFTMKVKQLVAFGLGADLLKQVTDLGPDAGSAYADAILEGGADGIASLNGLQSQISQAADELARYGGTHLYQGGVDAAQSLVDGLGAQDKALADQGKALAAAFQQSFLAGLKIPQATLDAVTSYFNTISDPVLKTQVVTPDAGTTTTAPVQRVSLPSPSQITRAEDGRVILEALKAYKKAFGPLDIEVR